MLQRKYCMCQFISCLHYNSVAMKIPQHPQRMFGNRLRKSKATLIYSENLELAMDITKL